MKSSKYNNTYGKGTRRSKNISITRRRFTWHMKQEPTKQYMKILGYTRRTIQNRKNNNTTHHIRQSI